MNLFRGNITLCAILACFLCVASPLSQQGAWR